jgi:hypothetical protein
MLKIHRACIILGYISISRRALIAVFTPKPLRNNYGQDKSFRPISLISFLLKAMERLVEKYTHDGILMTCPLHFHQRGCL